MADFMDLFEFDVILLIMAFLDDPVDLLRVSVVSHSWRHFVIANGLCKKLWLNEVPKIDKIAYIGGEIKTLYVHENAVNWEALLWEHKLYSSILLALKITINSPKNCISFAVGASSTNNHLREALINTVPPIDLFEGGSAYWSSQGETDPHVPESILYQLNAKIGVVTQIDIRPMKAFWEPGMPIYSAKSVRFRLGYSKSVDSWAADFAYPFQLGMPLPSLENYEWTYTSPEFPMSQEYTLQQFRLPKPVVWVGGILLIELLDRVQSNQNDGLFYIRLGYVRVLGRNLKPALNLLMTPLEELLMTCIPSKLEDVIRSFAEERLQRVEELEEEKMERRRQVSENLGDEIVERMMNLLNDD